MTRKQIELGILCWVGLLTTVEANAQKIKDIERRYKAGVRLVQLGDYDRARTELQAVMQQGNSYAPFAYYYYADASYRQKRYEAARTTLKELIDRFPNWLKKEEAYYLAAAAAYEQGLFEESEYSEPKRQRVLLVACAYWAPAVTAFVGLVVFGLKIAVAAAASLPEASFPISC